MNEYHTFHDVYLDNYYTPFPREKSNKQVLKFSSAKKIKGKTIIEIPPSVTASYMKKNPFYFDLKKFSKRITKTESNCPNSSTNRLCKSSTNFYQKNKIKNKNKIESGNENKSKSISKNKSKNKNKKNLYINPTINYRSIYEKEKLEELLADAKYATMAPRKRLEPGCELMTGLIYKPMSPRPKLTSEEALKIINKIDFPEVPKSNKFPNYLNEFRIREFIEREYERLVEEEKGYPPGTFKLWEEDRILILTNLYLIREELLDKLRKFPVNYYLRSIGINNRRRETEKRIDELDYAIKVFEAGDVYLKL